MRAIAGQETSKQGFENWPAKLRGRRRAAYIGDREAKKMLRVPARSALLPLSRLTSTPSKEVVPFFCPSFQSPL